MEAERGRQRKTKMVRKESYKKNYVGVKVDEEWRIWFNSGINDIQQKEDTFGHVQRLENQTPVYQQDF